MKNKVVLLIMAASALFTSVKVVANDRVTLTVPSVIQAEYTPEVFKQEAPVFYYDNFSEVIKPLVGYVPAYGDYVYPQWFSNPYGYPYGLQNTSTGCVHSLYQYYSEWVGKRCKTYGVSNVDGVLYVAIKLAAPGTDNVTCTIYWPLNEKDQYGNIITDFLVKTT